jgi:AraC-like DNA-binding protein
MDIASWKRDLPAVFNQICHEISINDVIVDWIDIIFEQIGNTSKCPPHAHTWFEFNYVLSGEMKTRFADRLVTVSEGDFYLIPPGMIHSHAYKVDKPHEGICIRWRIRPVAGEFPVRDSLFDRLSSLHQWKAGGYRDVYGIKDILLNLFAEAQTGVSPLAMQLLLVKLLDALTRVSDAGGALTEEKSSPLDILVRKVEIYLEDYKGDHFGVTGLAASLHMSYGHLCRLYKQHTGFTIIERMNRIRLEKAGTLLRNDTSMLIKEAAERSGFPDIYYFSKVFKKYYGQTPLAFRRSQGKMDGDAGG